MERNTYREVFAMLNAEREAAERSLEALRRLKKQIEADEEAAAFRFYDSKRRLEEFEEKHGK